MGSGKSLTRSEEEPGPRVGPEPPVTPWKSAQPADLLPILRVLSFNPEPPGRILEVLTQNAATPPMPDIGEWVCLPEIPSVK